MLLGHGRAGRQQPSRDCHEPVVEPAAEHRLLALLVVVRVDRAHEYPIPLDQK